MKINLPVIILKGMILMPYNEIRLEFENTNDNSVIEVSELFHDNQLLIISEDANIQNKLPNIGVISKITNKIELPNGKMRIIIKGKKRVKIYEYLNISNNNEALEAIVEPLEKENISEIETSAFIRKIYRELEQYIKNVPYISNSILSKLINITDLDKFTDIIAPNLPITFERLQFYLQIYKPSKRAQMLLEDIYTEMQMFNIEKQLDFKVKEELEHNQKEFILREKAKLIKEELGEIDRKDLEVDKLKERIENLKAPNFIKERLTNEIKRYELIPPMSPELNTTRNYIEWLLDIPWNKKTKDNNNLKDVRKKLDETHNGLDKVKIRIIEYLAVKQNTNFLKSPIICLVGPPGTGKTSLAFSVAKAMKRNFVKMSVGGVRDEAEILGHRKTYLGANPGRIIAGMKKAGVTNPIFLIDEIDKMREDYKGDPASALLSVLDPEQNKYFSDNYIEENYDLSNVMFILTANYIEDIPPALKDRLEIINVSGYTEYEKLDIAKQHLIPKIIKEHGAKSLNINFSNEVILKIIEEYTKESGVRDLKRNIETIVRKIVTEMVINKEKVDNLSITSKSLNDYLGKSKYKQRIKTNHFQVGIVNGLAYTRYGGDTLPIEVTYYSGKGDLILTGSLGDVMKESAQIALSYIKANYKQFKIDYDKIVNNDIHIHVPEGAVPKDGPSAGIALTTALISTLSNKKINSKIAMTGEITLRGDVLAIGGLKEKSLGAYRNKIKTIIIPHENIADLEDIPKEIIDKINYIPVKTYNEVLKHVMEKVQIN